jgi:hypothetical protein
MKSPQLDVHAAAAAIANAESSFPKAVDCEYDQDQTQTQEQNDSPARVDLDRFYISPEDDPNPFLQEDFLYNSIVCLYEKKRKVENVGVDEQLSKRMKTESPISSSDDSGSDGDEEFDLSCIFDQTENYLAAPLNTFF